MGSFGALSIPALGIAARVDNWGCRGGVLPNRIERWGCAGAGNTYLMGHAYGVFGRLNTAYSSGRLRAGMTARLTTRSGTRTYRLAWVRVVPASYVWHGLAGERWAWNSTSTPSLTLQTCRGAGDRYRLIVRYVAVG
jgi:sortase (surface protein transpeptidase)